MASVGRDNSSVGGGYYDPHFKRTLWYLIAGMKGGANRAKILEVIKSQPANVLVLGFFKNDGSFKLNLGILAYVAHSSDGFRKERIICGIQYSKKTVIS